MYQLLMQMSSLLGMTGMLSEFVLEKKSNLMVGNEKMISKV